MKEKDFDFPPYLYLVQVLNHCPKAGATYMQIWKGRNSKNTVVIRKKSIKEEYLTSTAKFRHDLLMLSREGLVNIQETPKTMSIELVGWDIDAEGFSLC